MPRTLFVLVVVLLMAGCRQTTPSPTSPDTADSLSTAAKGGVPGKPKPGQPPPTNGGVLSTSASSWRLFSGSTGPLSNAGGALVVTVPAEPNTINYLLSDSRITGTGLSAVASGQILALAGAPVFGWPVTTANNCPTPPASVRLFFWANAFRSGEFDRWWSIGSYTLIVGPWSQSVPLTPDRWSSVYGKTGTQAPAQFAAAVADVVSWGLTFGGGCFYGHGVWTTSGSAQFQVGSYVIQ